MIEFAQCQYCGLEDFAENMQEVPPVADDAAWDVLAEKHGTGCQWAETRAFRLTHHAEAGRLGGKSTSDAKKPPAAPTVN